MKLLKNKSKTVIILDVLIYLLALLITVKIRFSNNFNNAVVVHIVDFLPVLVCWLVLNYIEGLYSLKSLSKDGLIVSIIRSQLINILFAFGVFYLNPYAEITPKTNIFLIVAISSLLLYLSRRFYFFKSNKNLVNVLLLGAGKEVAEVKAFANNKPYLGYKVSTSHNLDNINLNLFDIFVIEDSLNKSDQCTVMNKVFCGKEVIGHSKFCESIIGKVPVSSLNANWFYLNDISDKDYLYEIIKFLVDRLTAIILILITIPIYLILFPVLLISSGRPFFYSQIRTGYRNKPFRIYKLRTMKTDAEISGAKWATPNDSRVTSMGKFLRASRLDELPQLWNILCGDMSLIGPRPERPEIIKSNLEGNIPFYKFRHLVKPGVTGWAQVNYGYGYSDDDSFIKLQYDLYYVKNKNIWLDLRILLKTIKTVLTGVGH